MSEKLPISEQDKTFWKGVAFLGAVTVGAAILL
jgi:hypothetical protein